MAVDVGGGGAGARWPGWPYGSPVYTPTQWPSYTQPAQQGWFGGGGGGAAGSTPWAGNIDWGAIPWETYAETPWAGVPEGRGKEAQQWFNTMLPWMQAQQQAGQFGEELDWRKIMDEFNQRFQQAQFEWQRGTDVWSQGFQESQLGQQRELELARQQAELEGASMAAWGRHRPGVTRWV